MKAFVCNACGFNSIDGTKPEKCPVCGNTVFNEIENAINEPQDENNLTELEKKHTPVIKVAKECGLIPEGCQDAHVRIGEILHPREEDHYIVFVDFYWDKKWIARMHLSHNVNPAGAVHLLQGSGKLSVVELCNKHGAWIKEIDFS